MSKLKVGRIVNTFGIKGELKVLSDSDFVEERFKVGNKVFLDENLEVEITSFRKHQNMVLITINHLNDINEVQQFKNMDIFFDKDKMQPLEKGFYLFQLEDLDVYTNGELIGKVIEVLKPAQTILKIKLADREIMLPYVDAFVESVDLENKSIHINLIEGF